MATERQLSITIIREISEDLIHPKAYDAFRRLAYTLELDHKHGKLGCLFKPFESFRHPWRQAELFRYGRGVTKARAYESAHQFGMAVDFVAFDGGRWSWDDKKPWQELKVRAEACGLRVPLEWDRAHVEHPMWEDWRETMKLL